MSSKLVLLVEDNLTNQKIIGKQLKSLGYAVKTVADGDLAVQAATQKQYNIILMDCQLPGIDGFQATIAIRQHEQTVLSGAALSAPPLRFQPAVIIAMTASNLPQDQERAIASGMNDYIKKPIQQSKLEAVLKHWMQKLEQPQAVSNAPEQVSQETDKVGSLPLEAYLDLHYLHQLSDDSPEFELELLQIFVKDSQDHLVILRQAIEQQNYSLAEQAAHHLHGSSANIGAKSIQSAAVELEQQAHQHRFQSIAFLLETIESSLCYIQAYLAQSSSKMY